MLERNLRVIKVSANSRSLGSGNEVIIDCEICFGRVGVVDRIIRERMR